MTRSILTAAFLVCAAPALAAALEPINQNKAITGPLLQGFIADRIADECPSIDGRKVKALSVLMDLRAYALDVGYSREEIRNLVESKAEKAKAKAQALDYLTSKGAVVGDAQSFCRVGEAEIAARTLAGRLLRKK